MVLKKSPAPAKWQAYAGVDGQLQYVSLRDVIGVKCPDEITGGVTLRLSNGHFVSLDASESLVQVLSDLNACC